MNLAITLLARVVTDDRVAEFVLPRLDLTRAPKSRLDRQGLEMFRDLLPILKRHPGDRVNVRRATPGRWLFAVDVAVALPQFWLDAAESPAVLLDRFNAGQPDGWTLPLSAPAAAPPADNPALRRAA